MPFLDRYTEKQKTESKFLSRYEVPLAEEEPKWWQKELTTLKELGKFVSGYTPTKEFILPLAKGAGRIPFVPREEALRISREEIEPVARMGKEMGIGLGRGVLDWLGLAGIPETRQRAMERIGERVEEHGYLAEAVHPLIGLGLGKGVFGRAMKLAPKKPVVPVEELIGLKKAPRTFGPEPPAVLESLLEQLKPKKEIFGKAEMGLAKELKAKGVTEKPAIKFSEAELKAEATEMLGEANLITKPNVVKGKGRRGVSVQYDPLTTPEWYTRTGMTKTEVLKGLKDISEKGSKAESAEAGRIQWMVEEWHKVKGEVRPKPTTEVFGGDLATGDRVKIKGEWYTAKSSPETGEVRLVDGKQIKLDVFEDIPVEEIVKVAKPKPTIPPELEPGKVKTVEDFLTNAEKAAKERIKKRGVRLTAGVDPAEMADYAIVGAAKIGKGAIKFADWSAAMIKEFGDTIKPHLRKIWTQSQGQLKKTKEEFAQGIKERKFVTSTKEQFPEMKAKVSGQYVPRSTDELGIKAQNLIKDDIGKAEELVRVGTGEEAVATASELIKHYNDLAQKTKGVGGEVFYDKAAEIANEMAVKLTDLGRAVQAASILGRLTPEGLLRFAAKEIRKYNIKHPTKTIPQLTKEQTAYILQEAKKVEAMPDGWQKAKGWRDLQNYISDLTPTPLWKKLINIWKAGLLTGIKTSGLNTMSNLFHGISEAVKDVPAVAVDKVASLFTGERTLGFTGKGVIGSIREGFGKGWRYMKTGYDERNVAIKLDWRRVSFGKSKFAKTLQIYEQTVFRSMGAEDQPFYYGAKARSLYSQAIAQAKNKGLKRGERGRFVGELVENPTDQMLKNAVNDAEIAVFQNRTAVGQIGRGIQKIPGGEFVVPFARTPSAVATQLFHYSPAGIVKTIVGNIGKGKFDQRAFSQGLGRGITGTGILYIGTELYKNDLMTLDYPKSEKERKLWELEGRKANSVYFLGKWRNPNVFGPAGMVLLTGGYFQEGINETGSLFGGIAQATSGGAKSLTDQTFLRGINQVTEALNNPDRFLPGYVTGTVGSIVPTIVGDIARATDPTKRRIESPLQSVQARIPGLRQTLEPRIDVLGQRAIRPGTFLQTMIDPTRPSGVKPTPVVKELRRLWEKGHRVSPTQLGNKKGYKGLTPQQNTKLWEDTGELLQRGLGRLVGSPKYRPLSDEKKADLINKLISKAKVRSRAKMTLILIRGLTKERTRTKLIELKEGGLLTKQVVAELNKIGKIP